MTADLYFDTDIKSLWKTRKLAQMVAARTSRPSGFFQGAPQASLAKDGFSDAGGLGFESCTGRITGKPIPSLWRDRHPAIKGLRPPEHCAGHSSWTSGVLRVKASP